MIQANALAGVPVTGASRRLGLPIARRDNRETLDSQSRGFGDRWDATPRSCQPSGAGRVLPAKRSSHPDPL